MLPLVALALAGVAVGVVLLGATLNRVVERSDCQSAADASALAGVAENRDSANELARANGARLVAYTASYGQVRVTVECGSSRASAIAERRLVNNRED